MPKLRAHNIALDDLGDAASGYTCVEMTRSPAVVHVRLTRAE